MGVGGSLLSAVALFRMYTSGSRGGCEGNYPFGAFAVYELLGGGGKGCRWDLLSGAVFLVCIPAERNVSVRGCFILCFRHPLLTNWMGGGEGVPRALTVSGGTLCMHASG